jgi:hypothetical protein
MKDTFEANLKSSQDAEKAAKAAFADLKTAKTQEIEAGQAQVDSKKQVWPRSVANWGIIYLERICI